MLGRSSSNFSIVLWELSPHCAVMLVCLIFLPCYLPFFMSPDSFLNPSDDLNDWKTKWVLRSAWRRQTGISQSIPLPNRKRQLQHLCFTWPPTWPKCRRVPAGHPAHAWCRTRPGTHCLPEKLQVSDLASWEYWKMFNDPGRNSGYWKGC